MLVNFLCQLAWARGAGKTLFLVVSVRVFQEEISIRMSRLRKEDLPLPVWACILQSVEVRIDQKGTGRANLLSLLELGHSLSPALRPQCCWFLGLWTLSSGL